MRAQRRVCLPGFPRGALALVLALASGSCSVIVDEEDTDCGNGVVEGLEECDHGDMAGMDCAAFGYDGGHLVCTPFCRIETWNCHNNNCPDGDCDHDENFDTCPEDCTDPPVCGDWKCDPTDDSACEDCDGVICGDGYCERLREGGTCDLDCGSAAYCGDGICQAWEQDRDYCEEDCVQTACNDDGVCEPDRLEPDNQCADCQGTPQCGDGACNDPEDDTNCPFDCAALDCGDGQVQHGEQCDVDAIFGRCEDRVSRAGPYFEGGDLRCNPDCYIDTWECRPRDLGAVCDGNSDCQEGMFEDAFCYIGGGGIGMCTLQCAVEDEPCGPSGASCHDVNGNNTFRCLWPCTETGDARCAAGLWCIQLPTGIGDYYCVPPDQ